MNLDTLVLALVALVAIGCFTVLGLGMILIRPSREEEGRPRNGPPVRQPPPPPWEASSTKSSADGGVDEEKS